MRIDSVADIAWLTNQRGRPNEVETPRPDGHPSHTLLVLSLTPTTNIRSWQLLGEFHELIGKLATRKWKV